MTTRDLPERVVVDANGAYWRGGTIRLTVDPETALAPEGESHFAHCPAAASWRKPKASREETGL